MAIRIRNIKGKLIALCAAKSKAKPGDVYLDDNAHHALTEKFYNDFKEEGFIASSKDCYCKIRDIRAYIHDHEIYDSAEVWVQAPQGLSRKWLNKHNYPDGHIREIEDGDGFKTLYIRAWGPMVFKQHKNLFFIEIDY